MDLSAAKIKSVLVILIFVTCNISIVKSNYTADWKSLDSRPNPEWYDKAKVGVMIHWGVYSAIPFGTEWFWYHWKTDKKPEYLSFVKKYHDPGFTYQQFASGFTATQFDPHKWAKLFQDSGAKYVVFSTKHHEGFTMWPSTYSFSWNAKELGPRRDVVGELATAIRANTSIVFGIYYSLFEFYNSIYQYDAEAPNYFNKTQKFSRGKVIPELMELVEKYKPEYIWADGDWMANDTYWWSKEFHAWLYNESPVKDTVLVNDRWGKGTSNTHGGVFTGSDGFNPGVLQHHKFENAISIDWMSWGYRGESSISEYFTGKAIITQLISSVSCGGNFLLNVGPDAQGNIDAIQEDRLRTMGQFLNTNGEAIYESSPWVHQNDTLEGFNW